MYVCLLITVPGGPPQNLVAELLALDTVNVSWSPPPSEVHFGIITKYMIDYFEIAETITTEPIYTSGNYASGDHASGEYASGAYASGDHVSRDHVSGDHASGDYTSGDYASGDHSETNSNAVVTVVTADLYITLTGLSSNTTYHIAVAAINGAGLSPFTIVTRSISPRKLLCICDWACENQAYLHKVHMFRKLYFSWTVLMIFMFCKFSLLSY